MTNDSPKVSPKPLTPELGGGLAVGSTQLFSSGETLNSAEIDIAFDAAVGATLAHRHSGAEALASGAANACPLCQAAEIKRLRVVLKNAVSVMEAVKTDIERTGEPRRDSFQVRISDETVGWMLGVMSDAGKLLNVRISDGGHET